MKNWWRRVRGALGMGLAWAVGWTPVGALLGSVEWVVHDPPFGLMRIVIVNAAALGMLGANGAAVLGVSVAGAATLLGAGSAAGSLALARRAVDGECPVVDQSPTEIAGVR